MSYISKQPNDEFLTIPSPEFKLVIIPAYLMELLHLKGYHYTDTLDLSKMYDILSKEDLTTFISTNTMSRKDILERCYRIPVDDFKAPFEESDLIDFVMERNLTNLFIDNPNVMTSLCKYTTGQRDFNRNTMEFCLHPLVIDNQTLFATIEIVDNEQKKAADEKLKYLVEFLDSHCRTHHENGEMRVEGLDLFKNYLSSMSSILL
jgi:hypothetical protein